MITFPTSISSGTYRKIIFTKKHFAIIISVLKHHNYEVDPCVSVLQAPESNKLTETEYPGQCWQTLSILDKISFGTKQVHK